MERLSIILLVVSTAWLFAYDNTGTTISLSQPMDTEDSDEGDHAPIAVAKELLETLRERGLLTETDREIETRLVDALLQSALLESPGDSTQQPHGEGLSTSVNGPWLLDGHTGYVRVRKVGSDFAAAMTRTMANDSFAKANAIILDLRTATGKGRPRDMRTTAELSEFKERPCAVLISPGTRGGAELLAAFLGTKSGAVLIGEATRGEPFRTIDVQLADGLKVPIPVKPAGTFSYPWPPRPVQPDLKLKGTEPAADSPPSAEQIGKDDALRRALDMMAMAVAVDNQ